MKSKNLEQLQWTKVLIDINNNKNTRITDIQERQKITLSHLTWIVNILSNKNMITRTIKGRDRNIMITTIGRDIARSCEELEKKLKLVNKNVV